MHKVTEYNTVQEHFNYTQGNVTYKLLFRSYENINDM